MKTGIAIITLIILISSCKKEEKVKPEFGTMIDLEGNVYKTVKIGNQIWMAENLRTTVFNDGKKIDYAWNVKDYKKPWYCWYDHDSIKNKYPFGALYNYYVVISDRIAPKGWHVPHRSEYETLINNCGGSSKAGGNLKSIDYFLAPNEGATNNSGFSALPSGRGYVNDTGTMNFSWLLYNGYLLYEVNKDSIGDVAIYYSSESIGKLIYEHSIEKALPVFESIRLVKD
jgi:uncharacterized protein (TIGR02145 family)